MSDPTTTTPSMQGRVALVTGATSGMGLVTAGALAAAGATTVLVARDAARGGAVVDRLRMSTGNQAVELLVGDLSVQAQVRRVAAAFVERHDRLHVLANNAGGYFAKRRESADGLEMTFALNHLGYFLLTVLLLDAMRASAPARIVNVSSDAHRDARIDWTDLQHGRSYKRLGFAAYGESKLANLLFTYELARRLDGTGVTANAVHPGFVASRFGRDNPAWVGWPIAVLAKVFGRSPERGAQTAIYLATSPDVEGVTGQYWADSRPAVSSPRSHDAAEARRLWSLSEHLCGLDSLTNTLHGKAAR